MIKVVLLLLYVWGNSEVKLEQKPYESLAVCQTEGIARVKELEKDPRFVGGLLAQCIELPVVEA